MKPRLACQCGPVHPDRMTGEHQASTNEGRTIRMSGATAYTFDDEDRITGHWQVTDRLGVFQQLQGAAPAP